MSPLDWLTMAQHSAPQVHAGRGSGAAFAVGADSSRTVLLTNHHVVAGQTSVRLTTADGRSVRAEVSASDPGLDLALLTADLPSIPLLPVAARPQLGDPVYALGHPWGRPWTLTRGVVSGLGSVQLGPERSGESLLSDVTLAPGNSGGPLLNARGEVLGVNSMVWAGGLGVAVPIWVALAWRGTLRRPAAV